MIDTALPTPLLLEQRDGNDNLSIGRSELQPIRHQVTDHLCQLVLISANLNCIKQVHISLLVH